MENLTFKVAQLGEELQRIISRTYQLLDESDQESIKNRLSHELEELKERDELRIAFVGQYNSGKSTILSALTGNKGIKISSNVETDVVSEYRWNNIVLLDTPGILAGKVEEHDLRTKEALKNSDLIVYVLTCQLFDDVIFENFIDLAYNQHLADKMLIAVNKMSKEHGDFNERSANYTQSINQIFAERGYEFNFPVVFIDARDYIEGTEDDDEDFIRLSNFNTFIRQLNTFIEQRGLIKKQFDTPIRILKGSISDLAVSEVDPTLLDIYTHYMARIKKCMRDLEFDTRQEAANFEDSAISKVIEVSSYIGTVPDNEMQYKTEELSKYIDNLISAFTRNVEEKANANYEQLIAEMSEFVQKDSVVMYMNRVESSIASPNISEQERSNLERQKSFLSILSRGGDKLSRMANISSFGGVAQASGSQMHNIVYSVGKFFGHKFKPWEAVTTAAKIGKIGKVIPPLTAGIEIALDYKHARDEEKRRKAIRVARDNFEADVRSKILSIRRQLEHEVRISVIDNYDNKLNEINMMKIELGRTISSNKELQSKINELNGLYDSFLIRINNDDNIDDQVAIIN